MNRVSSSGSRSAGQLGDQREAMLVTFPSTRLVGWRGLVCARALTVPGHLRSSTGWEGGRVRGEHRRPQHLFSGQAICSVRPGLLVGPGRTHTMHPPTHPLRSMVRAEARWYMRHNKHMRTCSLYSPMYLYTSDSRPGVLTLQGVRLQLQGVRGKIVE